MDNLLNKQSLSLIRNVVTHYEECAVSGEYTLPEYCPDVTTMLKCVLQPRVLNRQQSGEQLLVDGEVCVRALYLDEDRKGVRCVEFALPFSCGVRGVGADGAGLPILQLTTKYVNCRAVTPRRLEVRGAVVVGVQTDERIVADVVMPTEEENLFCKNQQVDYSKAIGSIERVLSINEVLVFPDNLPAAEMLLGGECRCVVRECKLLNGKAIVKGEIYLHQLYTDDVKSGNSYPLDYVLPFSQILDLDGINETHRFVAQVLLLSDTERCGVGQDGASNVLELTAKLLVRLVVYQTETTTLVLDSYHTRYPVETHCEELRFCEHKGMAYEQVMLPFKLELPEQNLRGIVDAWVCPQVVNTHCDDGLAHINGRFVISILYKDSAECINFCEQTEDFHLEFPCDCESIMADVCVTDLRYRMVDNHLELQVGVWVCMQGVKRIAKQVVSSAKVCTDTPYTPQRSTVMAYYANAGESVWAVGRRCHASPERICRENGLTGDRVEQSSILLIPTV